MKASFENIKTRKGSQAFVAYLHSVPYFKFHWHYHPEYELTLITSGSGKRIMGDSYNSFETNDLVLIGPDLPHTWSTDMALKPRGPSKAIVIQFSDEIFAGLWDSMEFRAIKTLLLKSVRGISFPLTAKLQSDITLLPRKKGVGKISLLLQILETLSSLQGTLLSTVGFAPVRSIQTEKRINTVCDFVQRNFNRSITLNDAANCIHLSPSAFSKFIKKSLGKTYSEYVNDVRIAHASRLLIESDHSVREISFLSGFESITYFNRVFLRKYKVRPTEYRKGTRS